MRNLINLTDSEIESIFREAGDGIDIDSAVYTLDTLENFNEAALLYAERKTPKFGIEEGYKTLFIGGAQVKKGDQRRNILIVDFGNIRVVSM